MAALMIVQRHTGDWFGLPGGQESYLAVDLFFVLSGVVISNAYESRLKAGLSFVEFVWLRVVRLYPLYLIGLSFAVAATILSQGGASIHYLSRLLIFALLFLPYPRDESDSVGSIFPLNVPAWSLFFELTANFIYAAIVRFCRIGSSSPFSLVRQQVSFSICIFLRVARI